MPPLSRNWNTPSKEMCLISLLKEERIASPPTPPKKKVYAITSDIKVNQCCSQLNSFFNFTEIYRHWKDVAMSIRELCIFIATNWHIVIDTYLHNYWFKLTWKCSRLAFNSSTNTLITVFLFWVITTLHYTFVRQKYFRTY